MQVGPHVRHRTWAHRTTGLDFSLFHALKCPVSGKSAALPCQNPKTGRHVEADFAALATGGKVHIAELQVVFLNDRCRQKQTFKLTKSGRC